MTEDSRYVCLTMPRVLMRVPYGKDTKPIDGLQLRRERHRRRTTRSTSGATRRMRWGRGSRMRSRRTAGARPSGAWKAAGWWTGCRAHIFQTEQGDVALKCPTETIITDRREKELADLGFAPLVHCKGTDYAAFFSVQTCPEAEARTTPKRPTPMRGCRRSCLTCWRCRDSRIT